MGVIRSVHITDSAEPSSLEKLMKQALDAGARSLFILGCDPVALDAAQISPILCNSPVAVFGGCFTSLVTDERLIESGFVVAGLHEDVPVSTFADVSRSTDDAGNTFEIPPDLTSAHSLLVLVDGLSPSIDARVTRLYDQLGPDHAVLGGGAGSLSFEQKPCIFTNEGLLQDCLQIVGLPCAMEMTVRHGWRKLEGPFLVTDSHGNEIRALNFRPAFDVYRDVVEQHSNQRFEDCEFFDIAKTYPFGLDRLDDEPLVRDPIIARDGTLTCVGEIPENSLIYILCGNADELIGAVGDAVDTLGNSSEAAGDVFVFDCVSRKLFMGDNFHRELGCIRSPFPGDARVLGALSLGEIASCGSGAIEFHNKTVVVGAT